MMKNKHGYAVPARNTGYLLMALIFVLSLSLIAPAQKKGKIKRAVFTSAYSDLQTDYGDYQTSYSSHACTAQFDVNIKDPAAETEMLFAEDLHGKDKFAERKIEWRLADGKPFAVIYRKEIFPEIGESGCDTEKTGELVRVVGLIDKEIDFTIDAAKTPDADQKARDLADGGYLNDPAVLVTSLRKKNRKKYKAEITRTFSGAREERLLNFAESVYPKGADRQKVCPYPGDDLPAEDWACGSFDGFLIPYGITKKSVSYYLQKTEEFRRGKTKGFKMYSSSLKYSAKIEFQKSYREEDKEFKDVYVVAMAFDWSHTCGSLCGLYIQTKRTVVLDKSGNVVHIGGDPVPPVVVS